LKRAVHFIGLTLAYTLAFSVISAGLRAASEGNGSNTINFEYRIF
jgi:hypothetical protein